MVKSFERTTPMAHIRSDSSETILLVLKYLLLYSGGLFWPQPGPFREVERGTWEIDAHFGSTGNYTLQLVTAGDLGNALIRYYRKVTQQNLERRERLKKKLQGEIDLSILGGDYPGIEMNGLLKGFQLEATVGVRVVPKISLLGTSAAPPSISRGNSLTIRYDIECSENAPKDIWLGASFRDANKRLFFNTIEDKAVSLTRGRSTYERNFTIAKDAPPGEQAGHQRVARDRGQQPKIKMDCGQAFRN